MNDVRAISLHQPFASLMAIGIKKNETRRRATKVRGPLVICAAKRRPWLNELSIQLQQVIWKHRATLLPMVTIHSSKMNDKDLQYILDNLPMGKALCQVEVVDSIVIEEKFSAGLIVNNPEEYFSGNYWEGRHAWVTENLVTFKEPFPVVGLQGFFFLDGERIRQAIASANLNGMIDDMCRKGPKH